MQCKFFSHNKQLNINSVELKETTSDRTLEEINTEENKRKELQEKSLEDIEEIESREFKEKKIEEPKEMKNVELNAVFPEEDKIKDAEKKKSKDAEETQIEKSKQWLIADIEMQEELIEENTLTIKVQPAAAGNTKADNMSN
jgi:hypothetical protein